MLCVHATTSGSSHLQVTAPGAKIYIHTYHPPLGDQLAPVVPLVSRASLPGVKQFVGHHSLITYAWLRQEMRNTTNLHQLLPILIRSWGNSLPRDRSCNQSHQEIWDPYHSIWDPYHSPLGNMGPLPLSPRRCGTPATLSQKI